MTGSPCPNCSQPIPLRWVPTQDRDEQLRQIERGIDTSTGHLRVCRYQATPEDPSR